MDETVLNTRKTKNQKKPEMSKKTFIVPHDFTPVADYALNHAIGTAKAVGGEIELLHVVAKDKQIVEAEGKLKAVVEKANTDGVEVRANVRIGNIFDDIGNFASEKHAELIFMGTHGASGWQHVVGSKALKVITSSEVPFIVVQEKKIAEEGRAILIRKLRHLKINTNERVFNEMASYFSLKTSFDLFYRIGNGAIDNQQLKAFANQRNNAFISFFKNRTYVNVPPNVDTSTCWEKTN